MGLRAAVARASMLALLMLMVCTSAFARARASGYCQQGGQVVVTSAVPSATRVQQSYPQCSVSVFYSSGAGGFVNTSGTAVTWVSGTPFNANSGWVGLQITIAGTPYTIQSVGSPTSITLTASAGTKTGATYSMPPTAPAAIFSDNNGTVLANPFVSTNTGFWAFYADNRAYDITANGGGIPAPFTWGAVQVIEAQNIPTQFSDNLIPSKYANLNNLCTAAAAAGEGATLSSAQPVATGFTCASGVRFLPGGSIQPASGQTVTFGASFSCPYAQKCLDTSTGGSFQFSIPPTLDASMFGAAVGATGGSMDTLYAPLTAAIASLPAVPGANGTVVGQITIGNSGPSGTYLISQGISTSSRMILKGGTPYNTSISPTSGFAPAATGTYMLSVINPNGSGAANNAFGTDIENLNFLASANGNGFLGGLCLDVSTGSVIRNVNVSTGNIGFVVGCSATPNADNLIAENLSCALAQVGGGPFPACVQYPILGGFAVAHSNKWINLAIVNSTVSAVGAQVSAINLGSGANNISADTTKCENVQFCLAIGIGDANIDFGTVNSACDGHGDGMTCTAQMWPQVVMFSPGASGSHVRVVDKGHKNLVVYADVRWPATALSLNYQTVDPTGCIQKVTTFGTSSAAQSLTWGGDGGSYGSCTSSVTTSDGSIVWTNEGAAASCAPGITNAPCLGATGATSTSDDAEYVADCYSWGCFSGNASTGDVLMAIQGSINAARFITGNLSIFNAGPGSPASVARSINLAANSTAQCQQIAWSNGANSNSALALQIAQSDCATGLQTGLSIATNNGGSLGGYGAVLDPGGTMGAAAGGNFKVVGTENISGLPASAGGGGLYICVDSGGNLYKKSSCP